MKIAMLSLTLLLACSISFSQGERSDALDEALGLVGMRRMDLGWTPKGWWPRYPEVPYKLRAFDSLFSAPLDSIAFARHLGSTARTLLDPAQLDTEQEFSSRNLFQAVQILGINPKFGGFRGYSANLTAPEIGLVDAILKLTEAAHRPTRIVSFGRELPYPKPREELSEKVKMIPINVSRILGKLVLNVMDAHAWVELAFRKVDANDRLKAATRFDMGHEMIDAYDYAPEFDDVARTMDEASLWFGALKCVQALDDARVELGKIDPKTIPPFSFDWETPWGWIRVRGSGNDQIRGNDTLLLVDLGGDDTYTGDIAASTAQRSIGLLLDMAGNATYSSDGPAQGAGVCGVGVLIDREGNDEYNNHRYGQGVGQFGLGLCADLGGDDRYFNRFSGQGCGYFGIGLLFDIAGTDHYTLYGEGQGLGGVNGVGVLADRSGNDRYTAVRDQNTTGRPSAYWPELGVGDSNAQGCGLGRRGDGSDGHSWAGGLGALLDGEGNDVYLSGNWSMGTGYWFGIGVLHDARGDDEYHGVAYSQASGAHFCIGVMIDEDGNDKMLAEENSHRSVAFAHDFSIGILLNVRGDDIYRGDSYCLAHANNRGLAMLMDLGGNDVYQTKEVARPGFSFIDPAFRNRHGVSTYFADATSIGLFLDIGGRDTYWGDLKDNTQWLDPKDSTNWADRNFSVAVDRNEGQVDFTPVPVKMPSKK